MAQQMLTVMAAAAADDSPDPTQQQQQHVTPRIKVKGRRRVKSRTSYSLSLKLKAVEEAERSGLRAAAISLKLDERVLRQWLTKADELRQAGLTNAGSTRRLRSRSASTAGKVGATTSSPDDEVLEPSRVTRSATLLAVTPPSAGLLVNDPHNPLSVSSPSADGSPCSSSHSTSCSSSLVVSRADACVGTSSVSTMTEPEFLGPCEPGTAVTLEGIVWHETEGGMLVVNVTWRNKTYVGTLMDSTKNHWAPPRFCDSPTSDSESKGPKGRPKRGRTTTSTPVMSGGSFGDVSSGSVDGKLRSGAKGRRGGLLTPPSPAKEMTPSGVKRKGNTNIGTSGCSGVTNADDEATGSANKRSCSSSREARSSSPSMDPSTSSTVASPMLLECPESNCSKKYRNVNGLRYHQSHAHGIVNFGFNFHETTGPHGKDDKDIPKNDKEPLTSSTTPHQEEAMEEAPFTGKVPMPPPSEPNRPFNIDSFHSMVEYLSRHCPKLLSSKVSNQPPADGHVFTPVVTQSKTSQSNLTSATTRTTSTTSGSPAMAVKPKIDESDLRKKSPRRPASTAVTNSSSPVTVTKDPLPSSKSNRENVQSPAYSDISDPNDQSAPLLDDRLSTQPTKLSEYFEGKEKEVGSVNPVAGPSDPKATFKPSNSFAESAPYVPPKTGQPKAKKVEKTGKKQDESRTDSRRDLARHQRSSTAFAPSTSTSSGPSGSNQKVCEYSSSYSAKDPVETSYETSSKDKIFETRNKVGAQKTVRVAEKNLPPSSPSLSAQAGPSGQSSQSVSPSLPGFNSLGAILQQQQRRQIQEEQSKAGIYPPLTNPHHSPSVEGPFGSDRTSYGPRILPLGQEQSQQQLKQQQERMMRQIEQEAQLLREKYLLKFSHEQLKYKEQIMMASPYFQILREADQQALEAKKKDTHDKSMTTAEMHSSTFPPNIFPYNLIAHHNIPIPHPNPEVQARLTKWWYGIPRTPDQNETSSDTSTDGEDSCQQKPAKQQTQPQSQQHKTHDPNSQPSSSAVGTNKQAPSKSSTNRTSSQGCKLSKTRR